MTLAIDYDRMQQEEARLIILKELAIQPNESLSSSMMEPALNRFAIWRERPWIHLQLDHMALVGAIVLVSAGSVRIATLTAAGKRHLARQEFLEGIKVPSIVTSGI